MRWASALYLNVKATIFSPSPIVGYVWSNMAFNIVSHPNSRQSRHIHAGMRVGGLLLPLACFGYGCLYLYLPILYIYLGMYRVDSSTICTWIVDLVWPYYTLNCNAWCDASASNLWMRVCMWMCVFSKCKYRGSLSYTIFGFGESPCSSKLVYLKTI